jgi:energy-coupling factor transport system permease protein
MTAEIATPLAVSVVALLALRVLGRVPWSAMVRPLLFALVFGFGVFWTSALFYVGPGADAADGRGGPLHLSADGVLYGIAIALRLLAILTASMLFVLTTDPTKFVVALIHQAHVSPCIAYSVFAAYRFVPLLEVEFENIRAAHQMRGAATEGGTMRIARLREVLGYAVPLLAAAVRRGERVALAMESRAFGALPNRTYFRVTTFTRADGWFALITLTLLGLLLLRVLAARFSS